MILRLLLMCGGRSDCFMLGVGYLFEDFVDAYKEYRRRLLLFEDWVELSRLLGVDDGIIREVRDKYVEPYRVRARKILLAYGCNFRGRLFWRGNVVLEYGDWEVTYYRIGGDHKVVDVERFMNVDLKTALELLYLKSG